MTARHRFDPAWTSGLLIVACIGILTSWRIHNDYRTTMDAANARLSSLARAGDEQLSNGLRPLNIILQDVVDHVLATGTTDPKRLEDYMSARIHAWTEIRSVSVIDADGRIVATTKTQLRGFDAVNRPYFRAARALEARYQMVMIGPTRSLLGNKVVFVARPIHDGYEGGERHFRGVVSLSLSPSFFVDRLTSVQPDQGGWAALVGSDRYHRRGG